jgi:hypothetical protein
VYHTLQAHTNEPASVVRWALAILVAATSVVLLLSAPQVAKAAVGPSFPRLATWWPDTDTQSTADLARCDWIALQNYDAPHIAALRAANPGIVVLGSTSARELNYNFDDYNNPVNVALRSVSTDWFLTQVGSTLTANITASATSIPVADVTKFAVGEMVLVGNELMHIEAIGTSSLTVMARGPINPPAPHAAGTRIASVVSNWPGSITMDVSTNCPKRDVGYGLESWNDWNVRRGHAIVEAADWNGLLIDCFESNGSWMVSCGKNRSIDPFRTNQAVTDGYAAFNTAWNAGATAYGNALRAAVGSKLLIGNGNMRNYNMNGNIFEEFPYATLSPSTWSLIFVGPYSAPRASYPEWCANAAVSNLTMVQTYGAHTNYQLMRYGLCSTLMNDGYFSYALSSSGHARNGLDWFDEYDNAGAGRGYLGQPTGAATLVGTTWRRDFTGGISLVNPTASAVTVQLGGSFTKIKGTQAPTVNDGTTVTSVTLQPRDGIILLRPNVVVPPADTTAPVTTSDAKSTYVSSAAVKLSATDNVGVTATYYTVDGGARTSGTTISVTSAGSHTITFWSVDAAGNVEVPKSATFTITIPLPAGTMTIAGGAAQVTSPDVTIASSVTGAVDMRIDASTGTFGSWMAYSPSVQITLAGGYGTNMVRVEYRNAAGTIQLTGMIDLIQVVDPVVPTDPIDPVVPTDPIDPVVPTDPIDPVVPTDPIDPVVATVTVTPSLQASATTLDYGQTTTLRIALTPGCAMQVRVEKRTAGSLTWALVATLMTDGSGAAQLTVSPLTTTDYRVVVVDTETVSDTVTITVNAHTTIHSSRKIVHKTSHIVVSGTVSSSSTSTVLLQCSVRGTWRTVRRIRTSATGHYSTSVGFGIRGTHTYRIAIATRANRVRVLSATVRVRVL